MDIQKLSKIFLKLEEQSNRCTNGTLPSEEKPAYIQGTLCFLLQLQIDVVGGEQALAFSSIRPESQVAIRYLDELNAEMSLFFEDCKGNVDDDKTRILAFIRQEAQAKKIKQETLPINIEQYDPALEELIAYHRGTLRLLTLAKMAAYCISGLAAEDCMQLSDTNPSKKARTMIRNCHRHAEYFQQQKQVSPAESNYNLPLSNGFYGSYGPNAKSTNIIYVKNNDNNIPHNIIQNETNALEKNHDGGWDLPVFSLIIFSPYGKKYEQKKANILTANEMNMLYQIELFSIAHFASEQQLKMLFNTSVICPGEHQTNFYDTAETFWQQATKALTQTQPLLEKLNHTQAPKGKKFPEFVAHTITKICYALQGMGTHLGADSATPLAHKLFSVLRDISKKIEYKILLNEQIQQALQQNNIKTTPKEAHSKRGRPAQQIIHTSPVTLESWNSIEQFCNGVLEPMTQWQPQRGKKIQWREHVGRIIAHKLKAGRGCKFTPKEGMNPTTYQIIREIHSNPNTAARIIFLFLLKEVKKLKTSQDINHFLDRTVEQYQKSEPQLFALATTGQIDQIENFLAAAIFDKN